MLHTIYISAKQALESHRYNIQIQWYCWWVGNKNSHLTACKKPFFFFFFLSIQCWGRQRRNVFGYSLYKVLLYRNTNARRLKTFLHMNILQSNCIVNFLVYRSCILIFHELGWTFRGFFFLFLSLNCCDEKGHWDIARRRRTTDGERGEIKRQEEVEKIDRDRVGNKKRRAECERQEQRYCRLHRETEKSCCLGPMRFHFELWRVKNGVFAVEVAVGAGLAPL